VGPFKGSSSVNTVTISKTGTPATFSYRGSPVVQGGFGFGSTGGLSAISDSEEPIMGVCARYTTISNINLVSLGTKASDVEIGLMVFESFGGDSGAQHNVFDKITVDMDRTNTSTIGIFSKSITNPGGLQGTNSYNIYRDITIRDCYAGINIAGGTSADVGNQIISSSCTTFNSIGDPNVPNDMGGGSSFTYGIWMQNQGSFIIRNNVIRNLSTTSASATVDGILIPAGTGICEISNNIIRTLKRTSTSFGGIPRICGIRVASPNSTNTFRIFNNSISELLTSYTGVATATRDVRGIYIDDTGSGAITFDIWNNSISIDGSSAPNASNACLEIAEVGTRTFNIKNNVFANFTAAQTGVASHYCIISPTIDKYGVLGSLSDYNDLYVANDQGTSGHVGKGATTNYSTLAAWQSGMSFNIGTDANSLSANPLFVNNSSDLHGTYLSVSIDETGTIPPGYITTDIDCQARNAPHDMGIDDFTSGCAADGGIISPTTATLCAKDIYTMSSTGFTADPGATFQWMVSPTSGGPYSNVTGGNGAATTSYTTDKLTNGNWYYVMQTTCAGSGTDLSNELKLIVNSQPSATITADGPTTFCNGENVVLNAPTGANRIYQWKKGSSIIEGATMSSYTANKKGNYKVTVTNTSTGCTKTSPDPVKITEYAEPAAIITPQGPTTFCEGGSVVLQANTGGGLMYKWKKGSSFISGATLSSYTVTAQGNYKVEVTNANGCSKFSEITEVIVPCKLDENALTGFGVSIFPNPVSDELNIKLPSSEDFEIEIINATGQKIRSEQNQNSIDVSMLAGGVYFIKIYTAGSTVIEKFVKQ
ncbi:MAG: T9SS type A sorting domain-containing protein, partial [Chitinophagales bacterium]